MRDGLLLVDKHPNCTSHDVVQRVRRLLGQRKIGHCGTLDPGATGLLTVTAGKATRLTRFLVRAPKVYAGTIRFGVATDTYDAAGEVIEERPLGELDMNAIREAMGRFVGRYEQVAPPYSAKKHRGVRYYEMARRGEEVPEARKEVEIFEFEPTGELEDARLSFRTGCSSGTYVRSLAQDIGDALGCGAHLDALRRTEARPFSQADAVTLDDLRQATESGELETLLLPVWSALEQFPGLPLDSFESREIRQGKVLSLADRRDAGLYRLTGAGDAFIGLGEVTADGRLRAKRLMNTAT